MRILSLDGGGSKGMFALGVIEEVEAVLERETAQTFDLIYGTSTGAIIASLLALGEPAPQVRKIYIAEIPRIMSHKTKRARSQALRKVASEVIGERGFEDLEVPLGIVATRTDLRRPMIFKSTARQVIGRKASFVPGFGASLTDAVVASCAAFPFFEEVSVETAGDGDVGAIDGGFCANNPTLFAIIDALRGFETPPADLRVLSVGVGSYPDATPWWLRAVRRLWPLDLLDKTLTTNANSMSALVDLVFSEIAVVRVDAQHSDSRFRTTLLERDPEKLELIRQLGRDAFGEMEERIVALLE